jgi:S1-C subfamily serine protease
MNVVDAVIILCTLAAIGRGLREGLLQHGLSLLGFFLGLFAGSFLARHLVALVHTTLSRTLLALFLTIGVAILLSSLGEVAGTRLREVAHRVKLGTPDKILGAVLEIISVLVVSWLGASVLTSIPSNPVAHAVRTSAIIQAMDAHLPAAPNVIAGIEHLIDPNGFPKVFVGNEPSLALVNPATTAEAQAALTKAGTATVKIEGNGCGGIVEGSGFVAENNVVITNAHVVAGIAHPVVIDKNGTHQATPVLFDPNLDLAILRTSNLAGTPLAISSNLQNRGTTSVALGYPGGGGLTAVPAGILGDTNALGRNIYNEGLTNRDIYQLSADIEPGNSGGPLVLPDGTVVGVIFAKSTTDQNVGYALTSPPVLDDLRAVNANTGSVSTGTCAE